MSLRQRNRNSPSRVGITLKQKPNVVDSHFWQPPKKPSKLVKPFLWAVKIYHVFTNSNSESWYRVFLGIASILLLAKIINSVWFVKATWDMISKSGWSSDPKSEIFYKVNTPLFAAELETQAKLFYYATAQKWLKYKDLIFKSLIRFTGFCVTYHYAVELRDVDYNFFWIDAIIQMVQFLISIVVISWNSAWIVPKKYQ